MKPARIDGRVLAARAAFVVQRLGWPGWLGLAALVAGVLACLLGPRWLDGQRREDEAQRAAIEARLALLANPQLARRATDPLAAFVASLPPDAVMSRLVTDLQKRAEQSAVEIERTEYRMQPVVGQKVLRYRLRFPAHADYPHLRRWLEGLLHDYPSLILDELSLRRAADGGEELEVNVGLSFLARGLP